MLNRLTINTLNLILFSIGHSMVDFGSAIIGNYNLVGIKSKISIDQTLRYVSYVRCVTIYDLLAYVSANEIF